MIGDKLEELAGKQGQAADAFYLLLDGLEREGQRVTEGPMAAEDFTERLRMYMGCAPPYRGHTGGHQQGCGEAGRTGRW